MDQSCEDEDQGLHDWGHSGLVDLPYDVHEQVGIDLRLDFVEDLNHIVAQLHSCLLIGGWGEELLRYFNDLFCCSSLQDLLLTALMNESSQCTSSVQQEEHVLALVDIIKKLGESVQDLREFLWIVVLRLFQKCAQQVKHVSKDGRINNSLWLWLFNTSRSLLLVKLIQSSQAQSVSGHEHGLFVVNISCVLIVLPNDLHNERDESVGEDRPAVVVIGP